MAERVSVAEAARTGDRRATLEAMRDTLAVAFDDAPPAVVAQIAGRLSAILAELEALTAPAEGSAFDELANRRTDRLATAAVAKPAATAGDKRRR
jgi:hypothetical protein